MPALTRLAGPERQRRIEQAAARLFAERGYAATRIEDVVAAVGVTKPMLYRHFASKQQLHLALLANHRDALAAAALDAYLAQPQAPLRERLPAMLEAWFGYIENEPYALRLLLRDTTGDPEIQAFHRELQARQRAADAAIIRETLPDLPHEQVEPLAEVVRSSLTGLGLWWAEHPDAPRSLLVDSMLRVLDGLLLTAQAPAR